MDLPELKKLGIFKAGLRFQANTGEAAPVKHFTAAAKHFTQVTQAVPDRLLARGAKHFARFAVVRHVRYPRPMYLHLG